MESFYESRIVLCRIRLFPTLISKIKWFGSWLPLNLETLGPEVQAWVVQSVDPWSKDEVYIELRRPLTALQLSVKKLAATAGDNITSTVTISEAREYIQRFTTKTDEQKTLCGIIAQNISTLEYLQHNLNSSIRAFSGSILLFCGYLPEKLNPIIKPLLDATKVCSNNFTRDILASAFCSLLDQSRNRNPNLSKKLVKSLIGFISNDFNPEKSPFEGYTEEQINFFRDIGTDTESIRIVFQIYFWSTLIKFIWKQDFLVEVKIEFHPFLITAQSSFWSGLDPL